VLFLGIAAVMVGTRRVDWYALSPAANEAAKPEDAP
jgi:inner membrane protein involved in colicin E2 resistance